MLRGGKGWSLSRSAAVAVLGFVVSVIGALGGAFYLAPAQTSADSTARQIGIERTRSRMLLAATSFDDLAGQMESLLFSFSLPRNVSDEQRAAIGNLMLRGLDHRHDGVRAYLAALAVAGAIDFPPESSRYEALVAAERDNFNIDTYRAANTFEADLATRMVKAQGDAAMKAITLEPDRRETKRVASGRVFTLIAVTMLGSTIVFFATMAGAGPKSPAPSPVGAPRLLSLALTRLRTRNAA